MNLKETLAEQEEAFRVSFSPDERLKAIEELNCQGCILAGYPASQPMDRSVVHVA